MAENTSSQFNIHPMDQFIIEPIVAGSETLQWYSFSNQTLWMVICFFSIALVFIFGTRQNKIIPGIIKKYHFYMNFKNNYTYSK